jgi:hypothetical protein
MASEKKFGVLTVPLIVGIVALAILLVIGLAVLG